MGIVRAFVMVVLIAVAPAWAQTTRPQRSAEATALLDSVRQAYARLTALNASGTLQVELDAAGQSHSSRHDFQASFQAPNLFRHELSGDLLIVSDGKKAILYKVDQNRYLAVDAPPGRDGDEIPTAIQNHLLQQNPSLLLAISKDAGKALADSAASIEAADGASGPELRISTDDRDTRVSLDPKTRLITRFEVDYSKWLTKRGVPSVKQARVTITYAPAASPDAGVAYTWTPPADAALIRPVEADTSLAPSSEGAGQALVGQPAPDFTLNDLAGNAVTLKDLSGSVVLLDFWATWCGPCRMALPHLNALHKDLSAQGIRIFAVDLREDSATVKKFMAENRYELPVLLDGEGKVAAAYRVSGIPHTVIIGKDGKVRKVTVGYVAGAEEQLRQALLSAARE